MKISEDHINAIAARLEREGITGQYESADGRRQEAEIGLRFAELAELKDDDIDALLFAVEPESYSVERARSDVANALIHDTQPG